MAFVVIDEQHRFGVQQRQALAGKGGRERASNDGNTDSRTLAITAFGEMDTSILIHLVAVSYQERLGFTRAGNGADFQFL